jgi:hypothetical protein
MEIWNEQLWCFNYFCTMPKYKFLTLLKFPYLPRHDKSPLLSWTVNYNAKREWVNRSIEGDSSIRVWVAPTELRMHFMSNIVRVSGKHSFGASFNTSSFGVMSLRANVVFIIEILVLYFILGLLYIQNYL